SIEPKVDDVLSHFKESRNLEAYNLREVTRYDVYYAQFLGVNRLDTFYLRGRSVEPQERILKAVLEDIRGNVLVQRGTLDDHPCGIIVTEKFLDALGYPGDLKVVKKIWMPYNAE